MPAPWARGAQCRIVGRLHGSEVINVFNFATNTVVSDGPQLDALLLALATAMLACAFETLLPAVTSDYTLVQCDATGIYPVRTDPVIATAEAGAVGELGPVSASFISSLVNLRTGLGGRRGRGKKFLPPPGELQSANSLMDPGTDLLLKDFLLCLAGKFVGGAKTEQWDLGVLSRTDAGPTNANFNAGFRIVTQMSVNTTLAKMGSRKVGVGA